MHITARNGPYGWGLSQPLSASTKGGFNLLCTIPENRIPERVFERCRNRRGVHVCGRFFELRAVCSYLFLRCSCRSFLRNHFIDHCGVALVVLGRECGLSRVKRLTLEILEILASSSQVLL